jgi:hypothetical protein
MVFSFVALIAEKTQFAALGNGLFIECKIDSVPKLLFIQVREEILTLVQFEEFCIQVTARPNEPDPCFLWQPK